MAFVTRCLLPEGEGGSPDAVTICAKQWCSLRGKNRNDAMRLIFPNNLKTGKRYVH